MVNRTLTSKKLLILACSQRKREDKSLLPAVERYDGGSFRVLRKAQKDCSLLNRIDTLILSAKYGLIESRTPIYHYEQRMDSNRAKQLKSQVAEVLQDYSSRSFDYDEVYVDLGQDYRNAIVDLPKFFPESKIIFARGRIGERLKSLKKWLTQKNGG